jgi:hypothetical protein
MTTHLDVRRLRAADLIQLAASAAFLVTIFLPWYGTDADDPAARIQGRIGSVAAWHAHPIERWVLLAAVAGGLVSAWTTIRAHEVGWRRGEMAVVVAAALVVLLLFDAFISRPGSPSSAVGLRYGWYVALLVSLVAFGAAISRLPRALRGPPGI